MRDLRVLVLTPDLRFARKVAAVCGERSIDCSRLAALGTLPRRLGTDSRACVLLIDARGGLADGLETASTVAAVHPNVAVVLAADRPRARSENGFRIVDRWRSAEDVVDELELAYIGIPAYVVDRLHQPVPAPAEV